MLSRTASDHMHVPVPGEGTGKVVRATLPLRRSATGVATRRAGGMSLRHDGAVEGPRLTVTPKWLASMPLHSSSVS